MNDINKIWKKLTVTHKSTDFSQDPPIIKKWIEKTADYDHEGDTITELHYDENSKLKEEIIFHKNTIKIIEYDDTGKEVNSELSISGEDEFGSFVDTTMDSQGNRVEEKLVYDDRGRCIKKIFVENGKEDSWIDFEYDEADKVIKTRIFTKDYMDLYEEVIYETDDESLIRRITSDGIHKIKNEKKIASDKTYYITTCTEEYGKLIRRDEEIRDCEGNVLEQKFFDENDELTYHKIFGENDEFGYMTRLIERKYSGGVLHFENITEYDYQY